MALHRKERLRCAEAAEGTRGWVVGRNGLRANAHGGPLVRAAGVEGGAGADGGGECGIRATIDDDFNIRGEEFAFLANGGAVAYTAGMALGRGGHVFCAVIDDLDGMAGFICEQCGMAGDQARVFLFAAERSAGLGLENADLFVGKIEGNFKGSVDVERALHGPDNGDAFNVTFKVFSDFGQHAVGLDIKLLLGAGLVLAFDDEIGLREGCVNIAVLEVEVLEDVCGLAFAPDDLFFGQAVFHGEDGGEQIVGDLDGGYRNGKALAVRVGKEKDGLFGVIDIFFGEQGLVFEEERHEVAARNVFGRDNGELVPWDVVRERDANDAAARDGGADSGTVKEVRACKVVDIASLSEELGDGLFARHVVAYDAVGHVPLLWGKA